MDKRTLMKCPYCGEQFDLERSTAWVRDGSRACIRCGGRANEVEKVTEEVVKAKWVEPEACERCGASLEQGYSTRYQKKNDEYVPVEYICFKCNLAEKVSDYNRTGVLTMGLIRQALLQENSGKPTLNHVFYIPEKTLARILGADTEIQLGINSFASAVWYAGLQKYLDDARYSAHSANHNGIKAMMCTSGGRVLITLEGKVGENITVITAEDGNRTGAMGLQGLCATREQALSLLNQAIDAYKRGQLQFRPDTDVKIF